MIRILPIFGLLLAAWPAGTSAAPFCDVLSALSQRPDSTSVQLPLPFEPQVATCSTSLTISGQRDVHCHWTFAYRSKVSASVFDGMTVAVSRCLDPTVVMIRDQSVNHPDAYDLRIFRLDLHEYAVSLKDKGALQQTLVFLRAPVLQP